MSESYTSNIHINALHFNSRIWARAISQPFRPHWPILMCFFLPGTLHTSPVVPEVVICNSPCDTITPIKLFIADILLKYLYRQIALPLSATSPSGDSAYPFLPPRLKTCQIYIAMKIHSAVSSCWFPWQCSSNKVWAEVRSALEWSVYNEAFGELFWWQY